MNIVNKTEGRDELAKLFKGVGAEIGVEQGVYSEVICKANPGVRLFCVDAWEAYKGYRDHTRQSKLNNFYEITKKRLEPYNCIFMRKYSMDAVSEFKENSLDFVYIDANHAYSYVKEDLIAWTKRVKKGGIVAGHDYIRRKGQDEYYAVVQAVNEYCLEEKIDTLTIYRGDDAPSWMFIKP